jgi:hypothetical protein
MEGWIDRTNGVWACGEEISFRSLFLFFFFFFFCANLFGGYLWQIKNTPSIYSVSFVVYYFRF